MSLERHPSIACLLLVLTTAGCDALLPPRPPAPPKTAAPSPAHDLVERPPDQLVEGKILLGSPSLTAGITGNGPLALAEVEAWLADPKNHEPLEFVLPLGLRELASEVKIPADNPLTRAKIELGRQLFVDPRLSHPDRKIACFFCHIPLHSFTDHVVVGNPEGGLPKRVPPMTINRLFGEAQFWDGRAATLEAQTVMPIFSSHELGSSPAACLAFLEGNPVYRRQFEKIFGQVSVDNVGRALASFLRAIVTGPSRYDYWREQQRLRALPPGDSNPHEQAEADKLARLYPFSSVAQRGHALFTGKAGCADCHTGPNFTDEQFHNLGVGFDGPKPDLGRFLVTGKEADRGAFRTPTLRNVSRSPGYMHASQLSSLADVVDFFVAGGIANQQLDPALRPLELSKQEKAELLAFLESLTSPVPPVSLGRLPAEE
ncbi:MAG: cytochrome c peroxidase [Pirellulales bacterium]